MSNKLREVYDDTDKVPAGRIARVVRNAPILIEDNGQVKKATLLGKGWLGQVRIEVDGEERTISGGRQIVGVNSAVATKLMQD